MGTEKTPLIVAHVAIDCHRIFRKYRRCMKQRSMMLAAIKTMANPDPIRAPRRHDADAATQAATSELLHAASPLKSSARMGTTNNTFTAIPHTPPIRL